MKTLTSLLIVSIFIMLSGASFAQTGADSLKKMRPEFYRKTLSLDSGKAAQVARIQDEYKAALQVIVQDTSLALEIQRERMGALMLERSRKLRKLLNPAQQQKMIPETEPGKEKTGQSAN